jgi:hypothetical protein
VPKMKGSMRGNRRDGLRALPGPRTKARGGGGVPLSSQSPRDMMRKGRMRKRG